jgi:radical SAM family uncharacterized protein/radical SAM-linked protein
MALVFPDLYEIGMSHMGTRILYQVLNREPDIGCERAFAPWSDMESELRSRSVPLVTLENATPLRDFPIVGISLQYELTFTNCLLILDLGGIPLRAADRSESNPLIVGGGPIVTHPEPIAPFFDLFFVGEAEELLPEILRKESLWRGEGVKRRERLRRLDSMDACYAPSLHEAAQRSEAGPLVVAGNDEPETLARWTGVDTLSGWPCSAGGPVPSTEAVFDRISLEVMRGCTQGCRFCQAGILYRPIRERSPEEIRDNLLRAVRRTGWDEASLTALSPADHSRLLHTFRLAAHAAGPLDISLSVSSLRAYGLPGELLDDLRTGRGGTLTFAPEAATQRMRNVVNKNVSAQDLIETAAEVSRRGWSRIKLYFMLGLPTETDEDIERIVDLGVQVHRAAREVAPGRTPKVTCSVSTFVPKPHTPLQWAAMGWLDEIERKQALLRRAASGKPVRLRFHNPRSSVLEGALCRGDRSLSDVIETAYELGCRFDGWEERLDWEKWCEAFESCSTSMKEWMGGFRSDERLPWDHIHVGVDREFLSKERDRAMAAQPTPPCGVPDPDTGRINCHHCGAACDLRAIGQRYRRSVEGVPPAREPRAPSDPNEAFRYRISYAKRGAATLWSQLALVRHMPRTFRRAALAVEYSGGFHPKPLFTYAPPLPLGWQGLCELADVKLKEEISEQKRPLLDRLNSSAPEGLVFLDIVPLGHGDPSLPKLLSGAELYFDLGLASADSPPTLAELRSRAETFMASEHVIRPKRRKKGVRDVDLRSGVTRLEVLPSNRGDARALLSLRIGQGGPRPQEVIEHVFEPLEWILATRARLWTDRTQAKLISGLDATDPEEYAEYK